VKSASQVKTELKTGENSGIIEDSDGIRCPSGVADTPRATDGFITFGQKIRIMKNRFILYRRKLGGMFYVQDTKTRKQESLGTKDRAEAKALLNPTFRGHHCAVAARKSLRGQFAAKAARATGDKPNGFPEVCGFFIFLSSLKCLLKDCRNWF